MPLPVIRRVFTVVLFTIIYSQSLWAASGQRFALVIGNSQYLNASVLKNPENDSKDIARVLDDLDFRVSLLQDANRVQIELAVEQFLEHLSANKSVGLFYYAGHGIQINGDNYLVPVDIKLGSDHEIKNQSYNVARVLDGFARSSTQTNIIILDACRDNPFKNAIQGNSRSVGSESKRALINKNLPRLDTGLSKLDAPPNTLIAFATAPGRVADDGSGRNSPYTRELLKSMQRSGLSIEQMFRQVRSSVVKLTDGEQVPWESSSLIGGFYFKPRSSIPMGF